MTIEQLAGWSAILAAVATVVGAVFLGLFFSRGQPWGTWNDVASIVLMLATIPLALVVGTLELERGTTTAVVVAAIGIGGMLAAAGLQAALVTRLRTYEELIRPTLLAGAIVGVWYILAALLAFDGTLPQPLPWLAIASGVGFITVGIGFAAGGQSSRLAMVGGLVLLVASTVFLAWLGIDLVSGTIVVPSWNA